MNQIKRILPDEVIANCLVEFGYVTEVRLYTNPKKINFNEFTDEDLDRINPLLSLYTLHVLLPLYQAPILIDNVEDNAEKENGEPKVDKSIRAKTRLELSCYDKEVYTFYESNLLQGSTIKHAYSAIEDIQKLVTLSDELTADIASLRSEMYRSGDSDQILKYILDLNNRQKLAVGETLREIGDAVINEVFNIVRKTLVEA